MILDSLIVGWMERNIKHYVIRHDLMKGTFVLNIYNGGKIAYTIDIPDSVVINDNLPEFISIVLPHIREEDRK